MRTELLFFSLLMSVGISCKVHAQAQPVCTPHGLPGIWSKEATELCAAGNAIPTEKRDLILYSPDHGKFVHVVKEHWWVQIGGRRISPPSKEGYVGFPAELAWSPDGRAFYITWSEGNINGFVTDVYRVTDDRVERIPNINRVVEQDFARRHGCVLFGGARDSEAGTNVGGLAWVEGSRQLLLVAEVPPLGCSQAGYFGGYLVSVPDGRILNRFSPAELMRRWGKIAGVRLRSEYKYLPAHDKQMLP